ncbi:MAG: WecB/TagA/CpsF family glycosyltransferase [Elusimicrobiales bacterium]|nr:WecB/TagA/CpsF family glycosyltransferase [Elusimicrobiales bacterium]
MNNNFFNNIFSKLIFSRHEFNDLLNKRPTYITYLNPVNYKLYREDPQILNSVSNIHIDTLFMCKVLYLICRKKIERLSFDMNMLAYDLLDFCSKNKKTIFFIGGKKEEIEIFVKKIKNKFPDLNIKGYVDGYKDDYTIKNIWEKVGKSDFLIVGLGNVRQERFVAEIAKDKEYVFCMTCGAFITQTAISSDLNYYPNWIYKLNLRWLYRILREKNIFFRIIKYYPRTLFYIIYDYFRYKL